MNSLKVADLVGSAAVAVAHLAHLAADAQAVVDVPVAADAQLLETSSRLRWVRALR